MSFCAQGSVWLHAAAAVEADLQAARLVQISVEE